VGSLNGENITENGENLHRSAVQTDHLTADIARSELLLSLNDFHERLDGIFEEIRTLPQTMARRKARNCQSAVPE
jgi:hypothetical protein